MDAQNKSIIFRVARVAGCLLCLELNRQLVRLDLDPDDVVADEVSISTFCGMFEMLAHGRADQSLAARHERRPSGRALSLDIEVEQPHAFACELVDTRRGRTAKDATAVNA